MEIKLRKPKATDLFVASKIIKGIGIKNIVACFKSEEVKEYVKSLRSNDVEFTEEQTQKVGVLVSTNIAELIFEKIDVVQDDLIKFISNLTGFPIKDVEDLPIADFAEVVTLIIKEPDFVDFIKVVLKSFN